MMTDDEFAALNDAALDAMSDEDFLREAAPMLTEEDLGAMDEGELWDWLAEETERRRRTRRASVALRAFDIARRRRRARDDQKKEGNREGGEP